MPFNSARRCTFQDSPIPNAFRQTIRGREGTPNDAGLGGS